VLRPRGNRFKCKSAPPAQADGALSLLMELKGPERRFAYIAAYFTVQPYGLAVLTSTSSPFIACSRALTT